MKNAYIFPGQASQYVGMGIDLYDTYEQARSLFDKANEIMEMDLRQMCFEGPEEELKQTYITQPAIFVHSVAVAEILKDMGHQAQGVAGHSLGEYSALVAAGALSFEDGLRLVKKRGELMFKAGQEQPGTMAAIIGLDREKVEDLCAELGSNGVIRPANFNSPGQVAVSGEVYLVHKAIDRAREMGAMKAIELVVSGAFHSPLMEAAREGLQEALQKSEINDAVIPLYSNVEAQPVQDKKHIRELLYKQLTMPVLWQNIMEAMLADKYDHFYEVGPGKVLKGLLKRISRRTPCTELGTVEQLQNLGDHK